MNKLSILLALTLFICIGTKAQEPIRVDFYLGATKIEVGKQVIQPKPNDVIYIKFIYPKRVNIEAVSVKYYKLVPEEVKRKGDPQNQQQTQTMGKYILSKGNDKEYTVSLQNAMNPTISIPVNDFHDVYLSKLRFKILGCTDTEGNKLHKNNKVYEYYLPVLELMKKDGVVK